MFKVLTVIIVIVLCIACASPNKKPNSVVAASDRSADTSTDTSTNSMGYLKVAGDSMVIPSFEIEVSLSRKAKEKLAREQETIIVAAWFSGTPRDTTSIEFAESGEMFIQSFQAVLSESAIAKFEGVKFSKAKYDSLADKDLRVLINVYSGRKSVPDNLLDCAILSERMSVLKDKKFVLTGKLIGEPDSLEQKF